jgi:hypothetical protein
MAKACTKLASWPVSLRWFTALVVVPLLPLAVVIALLGIGWVLQLKTLMLILIAIGYALAACVPAVWLSFLPAYFAIDRWGTHSKANYQGASVAAVTAVTLLLILGAKLLYPSSHGIGIAVAFGLVVALPTAPLMATIIWCVLWSGREGEVVE